MTMKLTQLKTHWTAADAHTVITFLDELRDLIWATYGDDIVEMLQDATTYHAPGDEPDDFELNDELPF
jgi:hypothetical protein